MFVRGVKICGPKVRAKARQQQDAQIVENMEITTEEFIITLHMNKRLNV